MLEAVDDNKPSKGLAEVYEEEHVKNSNPDAYVSASDAALQREEREVEALWTNVSQQLDALSNWHYRPKPAAPTISVVSDVATIAMEDAQPATAQGLSGDAGSRMAPQEVYKPDAANGEVVTSAGLPVAREEMSREEKLRRRRRAKERSRKAGDGANGTAKPASKAATTMADLKKGGVKVINRKGEITDIQGNKAKASKPVSSGSFKL
jgi:U3 small nucleolar RNA-associated protein MPP10